MLVGGDHFWSDAENDKEIIYQGRKKCIVILENDKSQELNGQFNL